jgi:hypothetical protein
VNVLEGLIAHERAIGGSDQVRAARSRGDQYLLERHMLRRLSTGEIIDPTFMQFSFPNGYHYDVLRGLDYLRSAHAAVDKRAVEAIEVVRTKRRPDGHWNLDSVKPEQLEIGAAEEAGQPSRWITLRAMRVLRWASVI